MGNGGQLAGVVMMGVALLICIFCNGEDKWGRYDVSNQVVESRNEYFGLWKRCIYVSTGNFDCDNYDNYVLGSMPHMVAARGMVILGLGILPIAIILGLFAMDCTTMMQSNKAKIVTGVVGTLGGLCFLTTSIMMIAILMRNINNQFYAYGTHLAQPGSQWRGRRAFASATEISLPEESPCGATAVVCFVEENGEYKVWHPKKNEDENGLATRFYGIRAEDDFMSDSNVRFALSTWLALLGGLLGTAGGLVFLCSRGNEEEDEGNYHPQYSAPNSHKNSNKRQPSYL